MFSKRTVDNACQPFRNFTFRKRRPVTSLYKSHLLVCQRHNRYIIDRRTRPYRWREVNAIIEAVEHDSSCADADQAPESDPAVTVDYDALEAVSVQEAVAWANAQPCPVTLFLYDLGGGFSDSEHFYGLEDRFPTLGDDASG